MIWWWLLGVAVLLPLAAIVGAKVGFWNTAIGNGLWEIGSHVSRIGNFLMGGSLDETFSFRIAKHGEPSANKPCSLCSFLCRCLDRIDPHHCRDSVQWWRNQGTPYNAEHRDLAPFVVLWIFVIGLVLWFKPFGLT